MTPFPIKKNTSSKQGRSFKKCIECGKMAGSNNQIKCKGCACSNWTQSETTKRRKNPAKRTVNSKNVCPSKKRKVMLDKKALTKKRKVATTDEDMLNDMLGLLSQDVPLKQSSLPEVENVGVDMLDALDYLEPSDITLDEDIMFGELMSSMAAEKVTSDTDLSFVSDTVFDEFMGDIDVSTVEQVEIEMSSDEWIDNMFSEMSAGEMINEISV
jgi:hypothetical protein